MNNLDPANSYDSVIANLLECLDYRKSPDTRADFNPNFPRMNFCHGPYQAYMEIPTGAGTGAILFLSYVRWTFVVKKSDYQNPELAATALTQIFYQHLAQMFRNHSLIFHGNSRPLIFWRYQFPYMYIQDYLSEKIGVADKINSDYLSLKTRFAIMGASLHDLDFGIPPAKASDGEGEAETGNRPTEQPKVDPRGSC